ncbi:MAG: putative Na+/H+ antiporter [Rariglobus sp.]
MLQVLVSRAQAEPLNVAATLIFLLAIVHTFVAGKFRHRAHEIEKAHRARLAPGDEAVSFKGQVLHFFGEVEAVFGIWVIALAAAVTAFKGWPVVVDYIGNRVNFTEPMFVVVIMAIASTRPVLRLAEQGLRAVAMIGRGSVAAWWLAILILGPLLGSFITEPAAMTISALLLARQFYALKPSPRFAYATLGLLFVNISVGGTLTHFAAPPVLMVAGPWNWDLIHMLVHFGWKAATGITLSTIGYYLVFRREFAGLEQTRLDLRGDDRGDNTRPIPYWITTVQVLFVAAIVYFAHHPALFIGVFLFFLAFHQATRHHQSSLDLKPSLLVGFFLAGLVIHGGLQAWWIEPVLKSLGEIPLFITATVLTAFNDNAAITYLATLVPGFTDELKYMVVAGAVTGGGLTVIANAPNPAGQSILQRFFPNGVSPLGLMAGALVPTLVMAACFLWL